MRRKIIYLVNPVSGTREKTRMVARIRQRTEAANIPFEILPTVASGDYEFVENKIKDEQYTDVVICGGDGTVNQVVQSLARTKVRFGIIPVGSGNGLAFAAGISKSHNKALDLIFAGAAKLTDAFMVNDRFACMLCGLGLDAAVAHQFALAPKRGLGTYASLTTKHFISAKAYPFQINANKVAFETEAFFLSIANSNQFGNNFTIAPRAMLSDGLLDVVIVKKIAKPLLLLSVMKQMLAGKLNKIENSLSLPVIYFQTAELEIDNVGHAPMHIDGEPCENPRQLSIKVMPCYFNLIQAWQ
jgi:YegS/Rv2252/BmrU family lipid kinase